MLVKKSILVLGAVMMLPCLSVQARSVPATAVLTIGAGDVSMTHLLEPTSGLHAGQLSEGTSVAEGVVRQSNLPLHGVQLTWDNSVNPAFTGGSKAVAMVLREGSQGQEGFSARFRAETSVTGLAEDYNGRYFLAEPQNEFKYEVVVTDKYEIKGGIYKMAIQAEAISA